MGLFGIELDNPTANIVDVGLFELGGSPSQTIYNGIKTQSGSLESGMTLVTPTFLTSSFLNYVGNISEVNANINQNVPVNPSEVLLTTTSSFPLNANGGRIIEYSDLSTNTVLQSDVSAGLSIVDFTDEIKRLFEIKVGETNVISITPITTIRLNSASQYSITLKWTVNYLKSNSYIENTASFTPLRKIELKGGGVIINFGIPTSNANPLVMWEETFTTIDGIVVKGTTGDDYGQILRGQSSEPMAINSMRVTPLQSITNTENNRISQLLQPIKFTRVDSNGQSNTYVLNPTVDLYQATTTLDYLNLGTRTDDFPFDGNTRFGYSLLPFSSVKLQFDNVSISNFIFANKKLVEEVVELNKRNRKKAEYLSKISREYKI